MIGILKKIVIESWKEVENQTKKEKENKQPPVVSDIQIRRQRYSRAALEKILMEKLWIKRWGEFEIR